MDPLIATRELPGARVSVISSGRGAYTPRFPADVEWITEDTLLDEHGLARVGINSLLVQTPQSTTVVDPGSFPPDATTMGGGSVLEPGPELGVALDALGVDPAAVDRVILTHGHDDHLRGVLDADGAVRFANAEHFFPAADREAIERGDMFNSDVARALLGPVEAAGRLRLVRGDAELGDGVSVWHTPGETDGHQIARFAVGDELVLYLGDLFHFPIEFQHPRWYIKPPTEAVADQLEQARERVFADLDAHAATLVFTHALFPAFGTAERDGDGPFVWRYT